MAEFLGLSHSKPLGRTHGSRLLGGSTIVTVQSLNVKYKIISKIKDFKYIH